MPESSPEPGISFEADLKLIREARGLSREEVYHRVHIRPEVLAQVENHGFASTPTLSSDIHRRSFVKHYADAVEIDAEVALDALAKSLAGTYDGLLAAAYLGQTARVPTASPKPVEEPAKAPAVTEADQDEPAVADDFDVVPEEEDLEQAAAVTEAVEDGPAVADDFDVTPEEDEDQAGSATEELPDFDIPRPVRDEPPVFPVPETETEPAWARVDDQLPGEDDAKGKESDGDEDELTISEVEHGVAQAGEIDSGTEVPDEGQAPLEDATHQPESPVKPTQDAPQVEELAASHEAAPLSGKIAEEAEPAAASSADVEEIDVDDLGATEPEGESPGMSSKEDAEEQTLDEPLDEEGSPDTGVALPASPYAPPMPGRPHARQPVDEPSPEPEPAAPEIKDTDQPKPAFVETASSHREVSSIPKSTMKESHIGPLDEHDMGDEISLPLRIRGHWVTWTGLAGVALVLLFLAGEAIFGTRSAPPVPRPVISEVSELPRQFSGIVRLTPRSERFVTLQIIPDSMSTTDFEYKIWTHSAGSTFAETGEGTLDLEGDQLLLGEPYGVGGLFVLEDGQVRLRSVRRVRFPRWEFTGRGR